MSSKKSQGHGGQPPPAPPEEPLAPLTPAPVAPGTVTTETPIGTLAADPFEPPLPVPPVDPSAGTEAAREALTKLEDDRKQVEEERENLAKEREALEKARLQLEEDRKALQGRNGAPPAPVRPEDERLVEVRAVVDMIDPLRVQHRFAGDEFRLRARDAEEFEERGLVEIL
jgi:hypothetical protein